MWTKDSIHNLLSSNDKAVARAVLAIYARQTNDEQATESTRHTNGAGFNHADAQRGSYYATYVQRTGRLTGRHLELARKMVGKYWRQLAEIANEKAAPVVEPDAGNIEEAMLADAEMNEIMRQAEVEEERQRQAYKFARDGVRW